MYCRQLILLAWCWQILARIDLRKQTLKLFGLEIGTRLIKKDFMKGTEADTGGCNKQQLGN
jgi:hypothetical protein